MNHNTTETKRLQRFKGETSDVYIGLNEYYHGGVRARRHCAEQGSPSSQTKKPEWRKGLTAMAKNVFNKVNHICPVALEFAGWCCFVLGTIISVPVSAKVILLSVARVLP